MFRINKWLDNNLVIIEFKKTVEVDHNARDVKKEVLITFEIREKVERVPIAFIIKKEIEKFERIELV